MPWLIVNAAATSAAAQSQKSHAQSARWSAPVRRPLPSATLRVAPSASWMLEYYPIRELRQLPDGSCEVAMTYASEDWMTRLLLGFGSDVRVLAPESLAQRVRDAATAALDAYQAAAPP